MGILPGMLLIAQVTVYVNVGDKYANKITNH